MADNLQYPQDTVSGGTSVMSATDSEGAKWSYDNDAGKWVNLVSGTALSPAEFSEHAGRGGNAAQGTIALAQAMRQEEASLVPTPRPQPQAPSVPTAIAPPQTGTAPTPQAISAPIAPPGGTPIAPPQDQIDPAYRQRLMAQQPVPGTRTPPSPSAIQNYNLQAYQRAVASGMDKKAAAQIYLGPMLAAQGMAKPTPVPPHRDVAGVLYERNPSTGEWEAKTKPKASITRPAPKDPVLLADIGDLRKRLLEVDKSVAKGDLTEEEARKLTEKYQGQLDDLKQKYYGTATGTGTTSAPAAREPGRGIGVLKPEGAPAESGGKGKLSRDQARAFLNQANGDKDKARKMALAAGYTL